jgi:DNA-binding MarR family transcriptional regulator
MAKREDRASGQSGPAKKSARAKKRQGDPEFELQSLRLFEAMRELRKISFRELYVEIYGEADEALEPAQYEALEVLVTRSEWRMTDFARALQVEPSTATRMVDRLVKAGVAVRKSSRSDGRGVVIRASRSGRLRRTRVVEGRREMMHDFVEPFTDREVDTLINLMERLADNIAQAADDRAVRASGTKPRGEMLAEVRELDPSGSQWD